MSTTDLQCALINAFFHFELNNYFEDDLIYFKKKLEQYPNLWQFTLNFYKTLNLDTYKFYLILQSAERN